MSKDKSKKNDRRKFLKESFLVGAGIAGGVGISNILKASSLPVEKIKVLTTDGKIIEVDKDLVYNTPSCSPIPKGEEAKKGIPGRNFVMVIDLSKCANARKCIEGCQEGHNLAPNQEFIPVNLMKETQYSEPYWFPKPCYHCDNPSCVKVCPVGATFKRSDGTVLVDADQCIGCKFCVSACPYSARIFNWGHRDVFEENSADYSPETQVPGQEGTVIKCDFCPDRSREGKLPYCVISCPMGAIYFGDANEDAITNGEETMRLAETVNDKAGYQFMKHLGTKPRVYYLPPVNRSFPYERGFENLTEEQKARYEEILKSEDKKNGLT